MHCSEFPSDVPILVLHFSLIPNFPYCLYHFGFLCPSNLIKANKCISECWSFFRYLCFNFVNSFLLWPICDLHGNLNGGDALYLKNLFSGRQCPLNVLVSVGLIITNLKCGCSLIIPAFGSLSLGLNWVGVRKLYFCLSYSWS